MAEILSILGSFAAILAIPVMIWQVYATKKDADNLPLGTASRIWVKVVSTLHRLVPPVDLLDVLLRRGRIRVGCVTYPPLLSFSVDTQSGAGLYADIFREVTRTADLAIEWIHLPWSDLRSAIDNQTVDLVLSIFATYNRHKFADFTAVLHRIPVAGITSIKNSRIIKLDDLQRSDVTIAVTEGEIGHEFAERFLQLKRNPQRFHISRGFDIKVAMDWVVSGTADVAIADALSCEIYMQEHPGTKMIFAGSDLINLCDTGIMYPPGNPKLGNWLDDQFSAALARRRDLQEQEAKILLQHPVTIRKA